MRSFVGTPFDVIKVLKGIVGDKGNVLMPTLSMNTFMKDYLESNPIFDVNRTPSMVGIIPEFFRRMKGVTRSIHPTHSVAAFGERARWFTEDHYKHVSPFENGTPYAKLYEVNAKIVLLAVGLQSVTLIHLVDDMLRQKLPIAVYLEKPYKTRIIINNNIEEMVTYVHNPEASKIRNWNAFAHYLKSANLVKTVHCKSRFSFPIHMIEVKKMVDEMENLAKKGVTIYRNRPIKQAK